MTLAWSAVRDRVRPAVEQLAHDVERLAFAACALDDDLAGLDAAPPNVFELAVRRIQSTAHELKTTFARVALTAERLSSVAALDEQGLRRAASAAVLACACGPARDRCFEAAHR